MKNEALTTFVNLPLNQLVDSSSLSRGTTSFKAFLTISLYSQGFDAVSGFQIAPGC
jgi:hypothetical protein